MNLNRIIVVLVVLVSGLLVATAGSFAAKGGKGGGKPPPPPPAECNDPSPSFVYVREGGRKSPDVTYIASADGCISAPLPGAVGSTVHMTGVLPDGSVNVVLVWKEDPSGQNVYQIRRADFTVNLVNSAFEVTPTIYPEPLPLEDPAVPDGDTLLYHFPDLWGSSTHDELYLVLTRSQSDVSGNGSRSLWIYNLDNPSDKRELYLTAQADLYWLCPGGTNPEAFAGCYVPETAKWNPDGTALYLQATLYSPDLTPDPDSVRWNSASRLTITRSAGEALQNWTISQQPEIVYTGSTTETVSEPWGLSARPRPMASSSDLILVGGGMLDVKACVEEEFNTGSAPPTDLWVSCLLPEFNTGDAGFGSWQSPEFVLHSVREKRKKSVFKTNILNGVSTKLIDDADGADTGN